MKKLSFIKIFSLLTLISICLFSLSVYGNEDSNLEKSRNLILNSNQLTEEKFYNELKNLEKNEIVQLGNIISEDENLSINEIMALAETLVVNEDDFTEMELISLIKDTNNALEFRNILTQFYAYKADKNSDFREIKEMLLDNNVNDLIKLSILSSFEFDPKDEEILIELANNEEAEISNVALRRLKNVNEELTQQIALKIIENYENEDSKKVKNALNIYSSLFTKIEDNKKSMKKFSEKISFKELCVSLLDNPTYSDTAAFALGNLYDYDSVKNVINSNVDFLTKLCVIDQNYSVLLENINENNLDIILEAMEILPINEFYYPISEILKSDNIKNDFIKEKGNKILELIQNEGVDANEKWNK